MGVSACWVVRGEMQIRVERRAGDYNGKERWIFEWNGDGGMKGDGMTGDASMNVDVGI